MFVGIGSEVHDKNNNYSADRKNDETACGHFFCMSADDANYRKWNDNEKWGPSGRPGDRGEKWFTIER
jgi:hypothetical protein